MPKLRPGVTRPADALDLGLPKVLRHGISQKALNELVEDWDILCKALEPFARYAEILPPIVEGTSRFTDSGVAFSLDWGGEQRVITFAELRAAKTILEKVIARVEDRRIVVAERAMAGHGDVCRLCGTVIEGADAFELEGYCSTTCQCEDKASEYPSDGRPGPWDTFRTRRRGPLG